MRTRWRSASCISLQTPAMAAPAAETELLGDFGTVEGTWQIQPSEYSPIATIPTSSIPQLAHCVLHPAGPPSILGDPWKVVAQPRQTSELRGDRAQLRERLQEGRRQARLEDA